MHSNPTWFTLIELIIGSMILALAALGIFLTASMIDTRDMMMSKELHHTYFHDYVFSVAQHLDFHEVPLWNTWYLSLEGNSFSLTTDPSANTSLLGFTRDFWVPVTHTLSVYDTTSFGDLTYTTYLITTTYDGETKVSYLTK